jgi:hypothetical protein
VEVELAILARPRVNGQATTATLSRELEERSAHIVEQPDSSSSPFLIGVEAEPCEESGGLRIPPGTSRALRQTGCFACWQRRRRRENSPEDVRSRIGPP